MPHLGSQWEAQQCVQTSVAALKDWVCHVLESWENREEGVGTPVKMQQRVLWSRVGSGPGGVGWGCSSPQCPSAWGLPLMQSAGRSEEQRKGRVRGEGAGPRQ